MHRRQSDQFAKPHLAAFGKHPGWDDHIDDPGLETEPLIAAKRAIYAEGVGRNIDAGAWDSLEESRRLDGFHHVFVFHTGADVVIGRMWSSSDGKGRTKYPMVVCSHLQGVALDWAVHATLHRLQTLEDQCAAASSAAEVVAALDAARESLRSALASAGEGALDTGSRINPIQKLLACPAMMNAAADSSSPPADSESPVGLLRILYQIEREMAPFRRVGSSTTTIRSKGGPPRPQQIRVPRCATNPEDALLAWAGFLLTQLHEAAPVLLVLPLEHDWLDIIVGEPTSTQLFCLRGNAEAVPLVTEVPFTFEPDFVQRALEFINAAKASDGLSLAFSGAAHARQQPGILRRLVSVVPGFRSTTAWLGACWLIAG